MAEFKGPEPMPGEHHDQYLRRLVEAFESWVRARFPEGEPE